MKPIYIHGSANISPQKTVNTDRLETLISYSGDHLNCVEPDYAELFDVKQLRRMSRVMKMGTAAALLALRNAGVAKPDAIIAGTGLGCMEDTGTFLSQVVKQNESGLNPTPFIYSTHNTVSSFIALQLQCQGYNQTYTHDNLSFESALLDVMLQASESTEQNFLFGAVDEITHTSQQIFRRFGIYRKQNENSLKIFESKSKGTLQGEGSAWFVVSSTPSKEKSKLVGVGTFYEASGRSATKFIEEFLIEHNTTSEQIDLVLQGKSGNTKSDRAFDFVQENFKSSSLGVYKHLCGEYSCSSSFALWLADSILRTGIIPATVLERDNSRKPQTILIYNRDLSNHSSLILIKTGEK